MTIPKRCGFRSAMLAELRSPAVLVLSVLWVLLGAVKYLNDGSWLLMTVPVFAIPAVWWRAWRRSQGKPVDAFSRRELTSGS